ncbi:hypothetical protein F4814DRAFT_452305 [Daldinia grandis]|nr:hypothetical protein F4814DRAFT_452305 [Daldinia grandis]
MDQPPVKPYNSYRRKCSTCGNELSSYYRFSRYRSKQCEECTQKQKLEQEQVAQGVPVSDQMDDQNQAGLSILAEEATIQDDQWSIDKDTSESTNEGIDLTQSPTPEYHGNNNTYGRTNTGFKYEEYENNSLDPMFQFPLSNCRHKLTDLAHNPQCEYSSNRNSIDHTLNHNENGSTFANYEPQIPKSNQSGEMAAPILKNSTDDAIPIGEHQENESIVANSTFPDRGCENSDAILVSENHDNKSTFANPVSHVRQENWQGRIVLPSLTMMLEHHKNNSNAAVPMPKYQESENTFTDPVFRHRGNYIVATGSTCGFNGLRIEDTTRMPRYQEDQSAIASFNVGFNSYITNNIGPISKSYEIQSTVARPVLNIPQHRQNNNGLARTKMSLSFICN